MNWFCSKIISYRGLILLHRIRTMFSLCNSKNESVWLLEVKAKYTLTYSVLLKRLLYYYFFPVILWYSSLLRKSNLRWVVNFLVLDFRRTDFLRFLFLKKHYLCYLKVVKVWNKGIDVRTVSSISFSINISSGLQNVIPFFIGISTMSSS